MKQRYAMAVHPSAGRPSKWPEKTAGNLQDRSVLVIGAGKMGEIALNHLHDLGVKKIYFDEPHRRKSGKFGKPV